MYYILNVNSRYDPIKCKESKKRDNYVDSWIQKKNIAPIFYGESTIDQILNSKEASDLSSKQHNDAKLFCQIGSASNNDDFIVSIGEFDIYIFKKNGEIVQGERWGSSIVKSFNIKIIKTVKIKDVPLVLASIKVNRWFSSGTFKQIKNIGNIKAIEYILNQEIQSVSSFEEYLLCLSSVELETLIAKLFEELGFFVPAYKGGFIRNIDLIARNRTNNIIEFNGVKIESNKSISIQLKLDLKKKDYKKNNGIGDDQKIDYYFCINSKLDENNIFKAKDIENILNNLPQTKKWLKESLHWVKYK